MLRNLLYSIFLHSLILLVIYFSFKKTFKKNEIAEITVNLLPFDPNKINHAKPIINNESKALEKKIEKPQEEIKKEEKVQPKSQEKIVNKKEIKKEQMIEKKIEKPKEEIKKEEKIEPKPEEKNPNIKEDLNPAQNATPIDEDQINGSLSSREIQNIQSQLKICYKKAVGESDLRSNMKIFVQIEIQKDGKIVFDFADIVDPEKYSSDARYKLAVDNVKKSLEFCSPLRNLPISKYETWKEAIVEFDDSEQSQSKN